MTVRDGATDTVYSAAAACDTTSATVGLSTSTFCWDATNTRIAVYAASDPSGKVLVSKSANVVYIPPGVDGTTVQNLTTEQATAQVIYNRGANTTLGSITARYSPSNNYVVHSWTASALNFRVTNPTIDARGARGGIRVSEDAGSGGNYGYISGGTITGAKDADYPAIYIAGSVTGYGVTDTAFTDCSYGIDALGCASCTFSRLTVTDFNPTAVSPYGVRFNTGTTSGQITDSLFSNICRYVGGVCNGSGTPIVLSTGGHLITRNKIVTGGVGVSVDYSTAGLADTTISFNSIISPANTALAVFTTPGDSYVNFLHNSIYGPGVGYGIVAENNEKQVRIGNNIVYVTTGTSGFAIRNDYTDVRTDYNNIYGAPGVVLAIIKTHNSTTLADWKTTAAADAAIFDLAGTAGAGEAHSISADPKFKSTSDLSLRAGSPAIDAGADLCSILVNATDLAGTAVCSGGTFVGKGKAPDMGAYEYVPTGGAFTGMMMGF